ncbi:MAG TPA: amino acid permease, partial [Micromonosporaceae bacterium]|nr:amino acid permease [Micromonosporaceae bacterium]
GLLNTFGVNLVKVLSDVSVWWHLAGVAVIVAVLAIKPANHYPIQSVFGHTVNLSSGLSGTGGLIYAILIGLLMAQYTFTGYDASAHLSEETHDASRSAPRGIVMSVVVSLVAGFILLFAVTWAIQDYGKESGAFFPPAQIFVDATGQTLGKLLLLIAVVAQFFCGMASVTANSRMAYAFSRDGALPGSRLWSRVSRRTGTPTNSIWLCVVCSVILVTPVFKNYQSYVAATSVAVIGLYVAYVIPVFLRLRNPEFKVGVWNLGRWSKPIGWTAVIWVGVICVLFMLPTIYPITWLNFNYTVVAVAVVLGGAWLWWAVSAKNWFTGPRPNIETADALAVPAPRDGVTIADVTVPDPDGTDAPTQVVAED